MKKTTFAVVVSMIAVSATVWSCEHADYWECLRMEVSPDNAAVVQNTTESWDVWCVFERYTWNGEEYDAIPTNDEPGKRNTSEDGTWNQKAPGVTHQWQAPGEIIYPPDSNNSCVDVLITGKGGAGNTYCRSTCSGCNAESTFAIDRDVYVIIGWPW